MTPVRLGAVLAVLVLALDQATKYGAVVLLDLGNRPPITLLPVLDLVLAHNRGISYSLFSADSAAGRIILIAVALAALAALAAWIVRTPSRLTAAALGLIAGGAAGNVIDRARLGAVIDFLYFHTSIWLGPLSNYVFNIADVGITAGVIVLLYESIISGRRAPTPSQTA